MSWWNMGGLNPKFKNFAEKHPDATMLGMSWALYWRFALVVFAVEAVLFIILFAAGASFGFGHHRGHGEWDKDSIQDSSMQGKLNIDVVCQGALAYMTFPDAASAKLFVEECKEGKHPEVIEQYKADMNLGDGATI